jgi:hypothetical protein
LIFLQNSHSLHLDSLYISILTFLQTFFEQVFMTTAHPTTRSVAAPAPEETQLLPKREMTIFRPPIIRSGANALNRALFLKKVTIAAAAVNDNRNISKYRKELERARKLLYAERISPVASHPDRTLAAQGRKCLLLDVGVKAEGES